MEEIWKNVETHQGKYEVSNLGRIRKTDSRKLLKTPINKNGYRIFCSKVHKTVTLHSLVAHAFLGKKPDGMCIDHIDNNRANACAENLRYVSNSVNIKKRYAGKGIGFFKMRKEKYSPQRYGIRIYIFKKRYLLGSVTCPIEAARIYQETHKEFFGYY